MDPFSVIVLALIYAALKGPGGAAGAVRSDYRGRRDRWSSRAEPWITPRGRGRGRGGRRVAGYDRNGRAYSDRQRSGRRRGDDGWWRDPQAWRGREGRARMARGVRPSAIRTGIITGALLYTAVFGAGVAARGFARGAAGGYQMGKLHYQGKRTLREDPTITVDAPDGPLDPDTEIVDAEIVPDPEPESQPAPQAAADDDTDTPGKPSEPGPAAAITQTPDMPPPGDVRTGPWLLIVHGPGVNRFTGADSEGIGIFDADELDRQLDLIASIPGLSAEVKPLPDPFQDPRPNPAGSTNPEQGETTVADHDGYEWQCPECGEPVVERPPARWLAANGPRPRFSHPDGEPLCPVMGAHGYEPAQPEPRDSRPTTAGSTPATPGDDSVSELTTTRGQAAPINTTGGQFVPVGASINAPVLMEGANYHAHLHNLQIIAREAQHEYHSAELTLASASAARQRAEYSMAAIEQMAVGLAAQDFGELHVGNMASLHELLARHVGHARAAENAARESLATSEQLIEMCLATAAVFQRDHGQLAEAHASAPHAAKTREAYQQM